ncbi:VanZ family protein [Seohaeicola zhoushanensis]|uniref:VanZ family protein n=1 Tax=Seohaeicola zhoushanensis TaxID=1569283 RepID=A0A8J3GTZ1_9RHOB|nr:VanZ family protein [Seohaeicola zhoushanensis]GHF33450.1 hypothetical protein GCM10017056_01080 [Seohaeicola zhoushanensis]
MPQRTPFHRLALAATAAIAVAIAVTTLMPVSGRPGPPGMDKIAHWLAFALLALPLAVAAPRSLVWLLPLSLAYGGAIELIQPHVGRSRELADFLADAAGSATGALVGMLLGWLTRRLRR